MNMSCEIEIGDDCLGRSQEVTSFTIATKIGNLVVTQSEGFLIGLKYYISDSRKNCTSGHYTITKPYSSLVQKTAQQISEYFDGKRKTFDVPIKLIGTRFQHAVWTEISKIPYGDTSTYSHVARQIGNDKASRAVGMTCGKNPISIIIPCHRVIGNAGKLTGYSGGIANKKFLLDLESSN